MGCMSSSAASRPVIPSSIPGDFTVIAQQVKQTWPDVKKINKLGEKTFAHLLYKYPEFKPLYHIPEAYKTEADLLNAKEIQEPSERFISFYGEIIQHSNTKFNEVVREKAVELYARNIRTNQIKVYGESLVHVIQYELNIDLTVEEKQAWQLFSSEVSRCLAVEMSKFPRRSIV
ncbi:unnamed protein product [Rotaria socialis]|uniref:Globin family profile domain-containing protein n=1 Tax=Rotaria socialis TaxID=392032 RepID=A0A817XQP3_9BILA|nr:unnamed protein product [Rotaria socialis]CAF3719910.1 unnamed protein product [Rotaria socialis]CAF4590619.1 unnamed protein product [Rotaria socialis]CAF4848892.1 unnamed protein product [Rotaria socialis]